jgi:hypothetical protein
MSDIVVTVPKTFTHPCAPGKQGLAAWIAEGDAAGDEPGRNFLHANDVEWEFSVYGARPVIASGERVYVVCEGKLRGFAPLERLEFSARRSTAPRLYGLGRSVFVRKGGAVAVTIPEAITGFRGWRYRWWDRSIEVPFPDWKTP